jgi:hypothetical protein
MKLIAVTIERLRTDKFNSFHRLMKAIDWEETPEGLERKFPRIFKEPLKK